MIRGNFQSIGGAPAPCVSVTVHIPSIGVAGINVRFLIDTGADRSLIGDRDANYMFRRFNVDSARLRRGPLSQGLGGVAEMRTAEATLRFDDFPITISIDILEPSPDVRFYVPSLLGRDVLAHFALFIEERTRKVLLLEPDEADALGLE